MRASGQRIVLTNGVFDLIHVGHVRYLDAAAALGDALIVGVNSDDSARRLKGPTRPINGQEERAEVVAALRAVAAVTIFGEATAETLVDLVRPDIYVKGGDYSPDPDDPRFPPEGRIVQAYGGQVAIIDYVPDRSTTALVQRLRDGSG